jgi:phosphoribosylformimino-5-aminoimidazole carboxamide ribonucleotide (ProFAR) isomerase
MIIYPDIEIYDGKCVNLSRGGFGEPDVYEITALDAAANFQQAGAKWLHIVDIDGVLQGGRHNAELICDVIDAVDIPVQVAGGIRTIRYENLPESSFATTTEMGTELKVLVISTGTVSSLDDVSSLKFLPNISGVIIGRALFTSVFTLEEAIEIGS